MNLTNIWGAFSYLSALFVAVYIVAMKLPRKKMFPLRLLCCTGVVILYKCCSDAFVYAIPTDDTVTLLFRVLDSFLLYCLSLLSIGFCFECDFWAMLFCSTAGYCMQHMSQRTYLLLVRFISVSIHPLLKALMLICITAGYYVILYFTMIRKADYRGTMLNNRIQIVVSCIAVLVTIFLNSFAHRAAIGFPSLQSYIMVFSCLTALLSFYVEFGWLAARKAEIEKSTVLQMAEDDSKQFQIEKDIIDLINVKCHDLKHQISALNGVIPPDEVKALQETVNIYDSIFKTGNHALDIVLTNRSLLCEKKGITLTCSIDGQPLQFLSDAEIFSLFSNLLDNAIEAVEQIEIPSKRLISLTGQSTCGTFVIQEENYLLTAPQFENNLPLTTKQDKRYHGFGTKSISMICEKHQGHCTMNVMQDIFEVQIVFPMVDGEAKEV